MTLAVLSRQAFSYRSSHERGKIHICGIGGGIRHNVLHMLGTASLGVGSGEYKRAFGGDV
jgi:hypothetical protein